MELVRDKKVKDAYMNSTIQAMFNRGELRNDHPLQRKPGRWNDNDKYGLIATVIKDEDVDSIKICEQLTPNGVILWVIDGLQRLTVLNGFRNGLFKLGKDVEMPIITYQSVKKDTNGNIQKDEYGSYVYETIAYDLRGKTYDDLPPELKDKFDNYKIDVVKHLDCTDEEIGYHIRRYNKQKSMNTSENAVTYLDNTAKYVKNISENCRFFKDYGSYNETDRKNGVINRIVMESIMCMFHLNDWKKQTKQIALYLNNNSNKDEFLKLEDNLHRLEKIINKDVKTLFNSKDSFIWLTLFNDFVNLGIDDIKFYEFLKEFMNGLRNKKVNGELFDEVDKGKGTKDKNIINKKLNILKKLMCEYFCINDEDLSGVNSLDFIKENVNPDVTDEDVEFYKDVLDDLTVNVDNNTKLLEEHNENSLLSIIAYSCDNDIDLEDWIVYFFNENKTYIINQKENYLYMKQNLENYINQNQQKSA